MLEHSSQPAARISEAVGLLALDRCARKTRLQQSAILWLGVILRNFLDKNHVNQKHPSKRHAFRGKKKQNGEGGLPPSPPHLLLACENRFYSFISIIMKGGGNDRIEARSREKRVYETTSESDVRGKPSIG